MLADDPVDVVRDYYGTAEPSKEQVRAYIEATEISEHLDSLPWGVANNIYQIIKVGSIATDVITMGVTAEFEQTEQAWRMLGSVVQATAQENPAPLMVEASRNLFDAAEGIWNLFELKQKADELFGTRPGTPIDLLAVDYSTFTDLFFAIGGLKVLGDRASDPENRELATVLLSQAMVAFNQSARQIAGMKMRTGGAVVALSIESNIALALMSINENYAHFLIEHWRKGSDAAVSSEHLFSGHENKIFGAEIKECLDQIQTLVNSPKMRSGIRGGTFSAKLGIMTVGLCQMQFKSHEIALQQIAEAETTLSNLGLESKKLSMILTPLTYSATLVKTGINLGIDWTVGPISYIEYVGVMLGSKMAEQAKTGISNGISVLANPGKNLGLHWVVNNSIGSLSAAQQALTSFDYRQFISSCMNVGGLATRSIETLVSWFNKGKTE